MERMILAAQRTVRWLDQQLQDDGSFGPDVDDLSCYYKVPYIFSLTGRRAAAHLVLDHIKTRFFQSTGDFTTSEKIKSATPVFGEFWAYTNGWIAIAAQRMGRFDVAQPAYDYIKTFFHPKLGGFTTHKPYSSGNELVDVISTSHLGLVSLYFGDIERAKKARLFLHEMMEKQPDPTTKIFLKADGRGSLVSIFPHDAGVFHQVHAHEPNQAYFMVGYPIAFLAKLYLATGERRFLATSKRYLDFAMNAKGNLRTFHFSHKVMWGASIVAQITGEFEYAKFASEIAEHLLKIQSGTGLWLESEPFYMMIDQSTEIAIWLIESADELSRMNILEPVRI